MTISKSEFLSRVASQTGLPKSTIASVFDAAKEVCIGELQDHGVAIVPGVCKLRVAVRKATPERQGINPFTKEPMTIAAKSASKKVKATPVKAIKDALS